MTRLRDLLARGLRSALARPGRTALTAFGIGVGAAAVLQLLGVAEAGPERRGAPARIPRLMVSNGERTSLASVWATTPERARRAGIPVIEGRPLADLDLRDARRVALIGAGVRAELFGFQGALLRPIEIEGSRFTVVGVLEPRPAPELAGELDPDRAVLVPESSAAGHLAILQLGPGPAPSAAATARGMPLARGSLAPLAAILLLLGAAALASAMLATGIERTRETAMRRVVGATRGEVFCELLFESVLVSAAGGLAGIAAALAATGASGAPPLWEAPAALAVAMLAGAAAGLGPALRAARLDPARVLREEL
jgi:putative ABC transport system permease protein